MCYAKSYAGARNPITQDPKRYSPSEHMLKSIYISNFAIINELELDFYAGMSVLTGETGAGKSIIVDALNLALGNRADRSAARDANKNVEVVATLDVSTIKPAATWLQEHDLYAGDDCVLRRIITPDGKSKAYINSTPCSVTVLRSISGFFVDVYGQHEHQSLMRKDKQRELLDSFSDNEKNIEKLAALYRLWQSLKNQLEIAESNQESTISQLELIRYQHQELEQLSLNKDEYDDLNHQFIRLNSAKELNQGGTRIAQQLSGESDDAIYDQLSSVIGELEKLSVKDEGLKESLENIQSIQIQLKETANTIRDYSEQISSNPQELQLLEERITAIEEVARKHKVKPSELVALQASIQADLERLESNHENPEKLKQSMFESEQHYRTLAKIISTARKSAANILNKKISDSMQDLGMQGGRFHIDVQAKKLPELSLTGLDDIQFMVQTNPGQSLRPLNKVVSGGELSRLSLAIQMATANNLCIPTLIFDEVDTGVGGATAEVVGKHLRNLGSGAQVFCVTHLPQVAAQAHHHYKVKKSEQGHSIATEIAHLTETARAEELARMLGGIEMTHNTQEHAKEMLRQVKS